MKTRRVISQERVKELLHYNPKTGIFTRKVRTANAINEGQRAGNITANGYREISLDNKKYYEQRLAWLYVYGYMPECEVHHKNGIKDNNKLKNLEELSYSCHALTRGLQSNNTSGIKGVWFDKSRSKYTAAVHLNDKKIQLGRYDTFDKAVVARWKGEVKYGFTKYSPQSTAYSHIEKNDLFNMIDNVNIEKRILSSSNTSGVSGVSWAKDRDKWYAKVKKDGKQYGLGHFLDFNDAVKARWEAEKEHNFPNYMTTSTAYNYLKQNNLIEGD